MEYAGYVRRGAPTDWSKVTGGIAKRLGTVEEGREKEREKLDTIFSESKKAIREVELGQNETNNQMILTKSQEGRDGIYQDYKDLKAGILLPSEYRRRNNNRHDSWGELNTAMKQQNARLEIENKMIDDGTASESMLYDNEQAALRMASDGYQYIWGEDGTLVSAKTDAQGNIIPSSIMPVSSLNKTQNVLSKRFDIKKAVGLDKIGKFKQVVKGMIVEGYDAMPEIDKFNAIVTKSILTSDDIIGKVLTDAAPIDRYFYYTTETELADKLAADDTLKKEWGVKKVLGRDGGMVAAPTPTQKTAAEKVITDWIKYEIGVKETPIPKKTDPGLDKKTERLDASYDAYLRANEVFNGKKLNDIIGNKVGNRTIVDAYPTAKGTVVVLRSGTGGNVKDEALDPIASAEGAMKFISVGGKGGKGTQSELDKQYGEGKTEYEKRQKGPLKIEKEKVVLKEVSWKDKIGIDDTSKAKGIRSWLKAPVLKESDIETASKNLRKYIKKHAKANMEYDFDDSEIVIKTDDANNTLTISIGGGAPFKIINSQWVVNDSQIKEVGTSIDNAINEFGKKYNKGGAGKPTFKEWKDAGGTGGWIAYKKEHP